jgi:hypothetical protein
VTDQDTVEDRASVGDGPDAPSVEPTPPIDRRELLRRAGSLPLAGLALSAAVLDAAHEHVAQGRSVEAKKSGQYRPRFFNAREWAAVRALAELVIPADAGSVGAVDAGVPEFIDFVLTDPLVEPAERERLQTRLRGGLAWLERECGERFGRGFLEASDGERKGVLDAIAWPERVLRPGLLPGVAFFTAFRDLVASGFWTSRAGMQDLHYLGNTFVAEWKGCPPEVLSRLGLGDR